MNAMILAGWSGVTLCFVICGMEMVSKEKNSLARSLFLFFAGNIMFVIFLVGVLSHL